MIIAVPPIAFLQRWACSVNLLALRVSLLFFPPLSCTTLSQAAVTAKAWGGSRGFSSSRWERYLIGQVTLHWQTLRKPSWAFYHRPASGWEKEWLGTVTGCLWSKGRQHGLSEDHSLGRRAEQGFIRHCGGGEGEGGVTRDQDSSRSNLLVAWGVQRAWWDRLIHPQTTADGLGPWTPQFHRSERGSWATCLSKQYSSEPDVTRVWLLQSLYSLSPALFCTGHIS